jgi:DNA-binding transcriptional LysR family regulator
VALAWRPVGFPAQGGSLLEDADVGLFVQPPAQPGLRTLALDASPMVVVMAAGHRLADLHMLTVADVVDEPFPGGPGLDSEWTAFWTLDAQRGGPPTRVAGEVTDAHQGLHVVAAGRAIATVPVWVANGLNHPGVVAMPLSDGPRVTTCLVWRDDDDNPALGALVDLATAWTRHGDSNGGSA